MHLQIQQGVLGPFGHIDPFSVHWKPIIEYSISDRTKKMERDFHKLNWNETEINLDDIDAINFYEHIVTGVRLRANSSLWLEVRFHGFNFENGKLENTDGVWIQNWNGTLQR